MFDKIIELLTKRKKEKNCSFCKKIFIGDEWKSYISILGFHTVSESYCSKKCEKAMHNATRKCFNGEKLTKQEKQATKNLRYVDIPDN